VDASRRANDEGLHRGGEQIDKEEHGNCLGCHGCFLRPFLLKAKISGESKSESYSGERIRRERGEDRDIKSKEHWMHEASMQLPLS